MMVGISFGNHYFAMTCVEITQERRIIKNINGNDTTPSVVHGRKNGEIIVGKRLKNFSIGYPK